MFCATSTHVNTLKTIVAEMSTMHAAMKGNCLHIGAWQSSTQVRCSEVAIPYYILHSSKLLVSSL